MNRPDIYANRRLVCVLSDEEIEALGRFMVSNSHPASAALRKLVLGATEIDQTGPFDAQALALRSVSGEYTLEQFKVFLQMVPGALKSVLAEAAD
jgi:hypothetical protein